MKARNIHIIGIGGSGVSAIAAIHSLLGKKVSGSDLSASSATDHLKTLGIKVYIGHDAGNIPRDTDLVIASLAIAPGNIELKTARKRKIHVKNYPEAVGDLSKDYYTIAVCGTHGKTTTTAMLARIFIAANFDPTVIVGSPLRELHGQNYRVGKKGKVLILEACEYRRAFLNYHPNIMVMNNIDADHFDSFHTFPSYVRAFLDFSKRLPNDGYFFGNLDDENVHVIMQQLQRKRFPSHNLFTYSNTYSFSDFYLSETHEILRKESPVGKLALRVPGEHNRMNALAAFSVASVIGILPKQILRTLEGFEGAGRRFEVMGKIGKTIIIDDFAHHPTEIQATLEAARERFPKANICTIFQPHQYSRTKFLLKEFGTAFKKSDVVIVPNIYEARDSAKDKKSVSAASLVREMERSGTKAIEGNGIVATTEYIKKHARQFNVIITMGAGDVWKIGKALLES